MSKIIVVVGATGQQGGSVIDSVLKDLQLSKEYRIRGTTRDTKSEKSKELQSKGVQMVEASVDDPASLDNAFAGSDIVFANTVTIYDGHAYEHEVTHGRALADAAVRAKVPYYIYSTLPNGQKNSGGKFKNMGHFDGKEDVEQYIRTLPMKSAFIAPGSFMSNFHQSMKPHPVGNGTYAWSTPVSPDTKMPMLDTAGDTGKWVTAIMMNFEKFEGKVTPCATSLYTMQECANALSKSSGRIVTYNQVPVEIFRRYLPPTMVDHITEMLLYFQDYGYYGGGTEEKVKEGAAQAIGPLTSLEEFLEKHPVQLE